jgi:hypothetical protein
MENLVKSAVKVGLLMVALENSQSNGTFWDNGSAAYHVAVEPWNLDSTIKNRFKRVMIPTYISSGWRLQCWMAKPSPCAMHRSRLKDS